MIKVFFLFHPLARKNTFGGKVRNIRQHIRFYYFSIDDILRYVFYIKKSIDTSNVIEQVIGGIAIIEFYEEFIFCRNNSKTTLKQKDNNGKKYFFEIF